MYRLFWVRCKLKGRPKKKQNKKTKQKNKQTNKQTKKPHQPQQQQQQQQQKVEGKQPRSHVSCMTELQTLFHIGERLIAIIIQPIP